MGSSGLKTGLEAGIPAALGIAATAMGQPGIGVPLIMSGVGTGAGGALGGNTGAMLGGTLGGLGGMGMSSAGLGGLAGLGSVGQGAANAISNTGYGGPGLQLSQAMQQNPMLASMLNVPGQSGFANALAPGQLNVAPTSLFGGASNAAAGSGQGGGGLAGMGLDALKSLSPLIGGGQKQQPSPTPMTGVPPVQPAQAQPMGSSTLPGAVAINSHLQNLRNWGLA